MAGSRKRKRSDGPPVVVRILLFGCKEFDKTRLVSNFFRYVHPETTRYENAATVYSHILDCDNTACQIVDVDSREEVGGLCNLLEQANAVFLCYYIGSSSSIRYINSVLGLLEGVKATLYLVRASTDDVLCLSRRLLHEERCLKSKLSNAHSVEIKLSLTAESVKSIDKVFDAAIGHALKYKVPK
ncbi:hypothetical protein CEXT_223491 [Caerostris extrusa]|uniref:Uncharacterized protein n=1 Tax=Caerostris extrusa TaxID=172846 RepID=A0AAV4XTI5_CAEEX|nr:hypothetical protein CEXT_223491 [Caerostris extrusa]